MTQLRQDFLRLIEQFSDEQLALLMPLVTAFQGGAAIEDFPSEASVAYQAWVGDENDVYDEIFADELATR
jgi:cytoplasmic iron level regulating protein YaaA (DUF328/UPF0246 family)